MRTLVEVTDVRLAPLDSERLWGRAIDAPKDRAESSIYALQLTGWVIGRRARVHTVEVLNDETRLSSIEHFEPRPDVAASYPQAPAAETSGFRSAISSLNLKPEFELRLRARLEDGDEVEIASIRGRRAPVRSGFEPRLNPVILTVLYRTGSTALLRTLAEHPEVLAYEPFQYEARVASYWMGVLLTLSEPSSYMRQFDMQVLGPRWWFALGERIPALRETNVTAWLGSTRIEALAGQLQDQIESFYREAARGHSENASRFVEKQAVGDSSAPVLTQLLWDLYPRTREVVLVRDFRDVVCSLVATRFKWFGRELTRDEVEQQIRGLPHSASRLLKACEDPRVHLLRYEDLIQEPRESLRQLLGYLELDPSETVLEAMVSALTERTPLTEQHRTTEGAAQSIGRWRRDLDPGLQQVCSQVLGPALEAFGYPAE